LEENEENPDSLALELLPNEKLGLEPKVVFPKNELFVEDWLPVPVPMLWEGM